MWQRGRGLGVDGFSISPSTSSGSGRGRPEFTSAADISAQEMQMQYGIRNTGRSTGRRHRDDDESLEEADDGDDMAYQPAPGSPGPEKAEEDEEDDDDPLDAFMAGIEVQAKKDKVAAEKSEKEPKEKETEKKTKSKKDKLGRTDIEDEDMQESYFTWLEENKPEMMQDDEDEDIEYDAEGNAFRKKKIIDPLPSVDHSTIEYEPVVKNFYEEHKDIKTLDTEQVRELRQKLGIKVVGILPPHPVCSFAHFGFDKDLLGIIRKSEYTQPTPIQSQGIPVAMSGRDIIGIAKTGSGKTAAYLWPALIHIMDQRELQPDDGPLALICVPTRELALQVYGEAKRFGKVYNINVVCAYGGGSKWEQSKALQEGAEIVVATPGRMIDMVKIGATNLKRVTYLVFDEADRMFDLGFEPQVRSIANHVRPDRQCLMFSATFKKRVEKLARETLTDPIRVIQGELGEANVDVEQTVVVLPQTNKWNWLLERLVNFCTVGKVLIFVTKILNAVELATNLKAKDFQLVLLHGDMLQQERNEVIQSFRKGSTPILVATDVAARGLDIPSIKTVVNFDIARDIDTHVHRIGRTGRAGEKGQAFTLVTEKDKEFAGHLVRNVESVNQQVPRQLMDLAMQSSWFRRSRYKKGEAKRIGGAGLGFRSRPGLGRTGKDEEQKPAAITLPKEVNRDNTNDKVKQAFDVMKSGSGSMGGGGRLNALKAAFSSSYQKSFHNASDETAWKSKHPAPPQENTEKRKRTRWE